MLIVKNLLDQITKRSLSCSVNDEYFNYSCESTMNLTLYKSEMTLDVPRLVLRDPFKVLINIEV